MRATIGMCGVFGLGVSVTVAIAQGPGQRGAFLLPPQRLETTEMPIARGSADELPLYGSTPAPRPVQAGGPNWLNGTDPNVRQASAIIPTNKQLPSAFSNGNPIDPGMPTKGLEKTKPAPKTVATDPRTQANATTPFRGTSANGAPVYAGPPAYRWYGWGSVTPGANPYAPTGITPPASANWFTITGATPGAFPVPVMNPLRPPPGTEPPAYVAVPAPRTPVATYTPTPPPPSFTTEMPRVVTPPAPQYLPTPTIAAPTPSITAPPITTSIAPPSMDLPNPIAPVAMPTITTPPHPLVPLSPATPENVSVSMKQPEPAGPRMGNTTVFVPPLPKLPESMNASATVPVLPTLPTIPTVSAAPLTPTLPVPAVVGEVPHPVATETKPLPTTDPAPLPVLTSDEPSWKPGNIKPGPNEWNPADMKPLPTLPTLPTTPVPPAPQMGQSRGRTEPIARGQVDDNQPDPVATLIRKVCDGRGDSVDVRWVGSKKLIVCFECRTQTEAQKLVKDISARPELAPYQIDFCVFVK